MVGNDLERLLIETFRHLCHNDQQTLIAAARAMLSPPAAQPLGSVAAPLRPSPRPH